MKYAKELNQPGSFFGKVFSYGGDKGSFIEFEKGTISESEFKIKFKQGKKERA